MILASRGIRRVFTTLRDCSEQAGRMKLGSLFTLDTNDQYIEGGEQGNKMTRFPAAGSDSGQLKYRETSRQAHTDALLAATQMNSYTKGELVRRLTQVVRDN